MRRLVLGLFVALTACTTAASHAVPETGPEPPVRGSTSGHVCRQQAHEQFIGKVASQELGTAMLRAYGARTIRWVQPGTMVTMDYREDRLTVRLASNNRVTTANCG